MVGAQPASLAAPQGEQERGEDISNPHHGKGSAWVPSPPPHPTGIWLPCRTGSKPLNLMPLKLALDLVSAWLKTLFPEDSSSLGQTTSTCRGTWDLQSRAVGGHARKAFPKWLFSESDPHPGGGRRSVSLPTVFPMPGLGSGAGIA